MKYVIVKNTTEIASIYSDVFLDKFPAERYRQIKDAGNSILPIQFMVDDNIIAGFALVIEKNIESTLHCWIGGVLPEYRHRGICSGFIDWIIQYGTENKYAHVTINTDNYKPDMLRVLVKFGFAIIGVEQTKYGDGNKIMLRFDIHATRKMRLSITNQCNMKCFFCHSEGNYISSVCKMPLSAIDQLLIQAQRLNFREITVTGGEPLMYPKGITRILDNCSRWSRFPYIKICTNGTLLDFDILQAIRNYPGKISLNISMHTMDENITPKITGIHIKHIKYDKLFSELNTYGIDYRLNYILLRGLNDSKETLRELFKYAMRRKIQDIHMLELLVTKEQTTLIPYYVSLETVVERIYQLSTDFQVDLLNKKDKKSEFILCKDDAVLKVVLFRLSCRQGCERCYVDNDIKIGANMHLYPCYLKNGWDCGNAVLNLKHAMEKRDEFFRSHGGEDNSLYWENNK